MINQSQDDLTSFGALDSAKPLVILQVSALDKGGGAEQVAWNLFKYYERLGIDSWLAVGKKRTQDPHVIPIPQELPNNWWARVWDGLSTFFNPLAGKVRGVLRLQAWMKSVAKGGDWIAELQGMENFHFPGSRNLIRLASIKPNILHMHNLHGGFFDLRALQKLSKELPTIITLHDAWMISGNCAHSLACERWQVGCGNCPDITLYPGLKMDSTAANWQRKRSIFENSRLYIATPSQWLMNKVQKSILAPALIETRVIPNGIDTKIYYPGDRSAVRRKFNLPEAEPMILFVANGIKNNQFKDYKTLQQAIEIIGQRCPHPVHFIALGESAPPEVWGNAKLTYIPKTTDVGLVADYYRAADIYVHAAKADTFPNTVLEAMATGLPVVASKVGGIPEQVIEGVTGLLSKAENPEDLAHCLEILLLNVELRSQMGAAALDRVQSFFTLERQASQYLAWYQEMLLRADGQVNLPG